MKTTTFKTIKRAISILLAAIISLSYTSFCFAGYADGEEIISNEMDAFEALGFDTSAMPEGFDEDSADNPYGTNNVALENIPELYFRSEATNKSYYDTYYGFDKPVGGSVEDYLSNNTISYSMAENENQFTSMIEADFTGSGKKARLFRCIFLRILMSRR